jgi:hypothetical protein
MYFRKDIELGPDEHIIYNKDGKTAFILNERTKQSRPIVVKEKTLEDLSDEEIDSKFMGIARNNIIGGKCKNMLQSLDMMEKDYPELYKRYVNTPKGKWVLHRQPSKKEEEINPRDIGNKFMILARAEVSNGNCRNLGDAQDKIVRDFPLLYQEYTEAIRRGWR